MDFLRDDHTKQLSLSRISIVLVLGVILIYAGVQVIKTGTLPDLGNGWLTYLLGQYGLNKGASTVTEIKTASATTTN